MTSSIGIERSASMNEASSARLQQFLKLLFEVQELSPSQSHLLEVMDSVAFQDAEAALQTTLFNAKHSMEQGSYKKT